jgi:hypothetical protein
MARDGSTRSQREYGRSRRRGNARFPYGLSPWSAGCDLLNHRTQSGVGPAMTMDICEAK